MVMQVNSGEVFIGRIDEFVKRPTLALRAISQNLRLTPCRHTLHINTLRLQDCVMLDLELFENSSDRDFYEFIFVFKNTLS